MTRNFAGASFFRLGGVAILLASGAAVACVAPAPAATCGGHKATIVVNAKSPLIVYGTAKDDVIAVVAGVHQVNGLGGNDTICADAVSTTLIGGEGNDRLIGGASSDRLDGGNGSDALVGGGGDDTLLGGAGADAMSGGPGTDTVSYVDHSSAVTATLDGHSLDGSDSEHDAIDSTVENLVGGTGDDTLTGNAGPNLLLGGGGDDRLDGLGGTDTLDGGDGHNYCDEDAGDASARDCSFDWNPPVAESVQVTTPNLDIEAGQQNVVIDVDATDDSSGIASLTVGLCGPNGGDVVGVHPAFAQLTSGTALDGSYEATIPLPATVPAGTWSVCVLRLQDTAWNMIQYTPTSPDPPAAPTRRLPPGTLTFTVANSVQLDTTPPVISDVSITSSADVSAADVTITADLTVTDAGAGVYSVSFYAGHQADADGPNESQRANAQLVAQDPTGNPGDGRYHASFVLPAGSAPGSWNASVTAEDNQMNVSRVYSTLQVIDANPITALPQIADASAIQLTPGGPVAISLHMVSAAGIPTNENLDLVLIGPHGQTGDGGLAFSSGTARDGVWAWTITLPAGAAAGTWSIDSVVFADALGRLVIIHASDSPVLAGLSWTVS